jgi:hypothetical protein
VGINKFKNYASSNLQGCVNDAMDMSSILQQFLGFAPGDVTILKDSQATKAAIMAKLTAMVNGAKAGKYSYLVFSLSSHGTQVPDVSGDEPDRADEAFCPHDLAQKGNAWDPNFIITDDELYALFTQLPESVLLEVYLDTCHSGSGLKGIDMLLTGRPRYLPPPSVEAFRAIEGKRSFGMRHQMANRALSHHILWAACRSDQTSADASIGGSWHGAFTYFFAKELRACKNSLLRTALLAKIRADLAAGHYSQVPRLECPATQRGIKLSK